MLKQLIIVIALLSASVVAFAGESQDSPFVKKRYSINGYATIETSTDETKLVFSDNFKTKNGPDLKIYLSKILLSDLSEKETDKDALRLSVLKSHKGAQTYIIPANIDLSDYESVLIQCEAYSVLWGGFDL